MIASKVICDDNYSNMSWCIAGQNLYTLKEREMCLYLEWLLDVEGPELKALSQRIKKYGPSPRIPLLNLPLSLLTPRPRPPPEPDGIRPHLVVSFSQTFLHIYFFLLQ